MSSGGSSQPEFNNVSIDRSGMEEFAQSTRGEKWHDSLNLLKNGQPVTRYNDPNNILVRDPNNRQTGYSNINYLVADYNDWLASQASSKKQYADYQNQTKEMMGRDATILTGPGASATKTLLG